MSPTSCPHQPCSAPADSCLRLLLWIQSISYLAFLFSCCLLCFLHYCLSQHPAFLYHAQSRTALVSLFFASSAFSGSVCSRTYVFVYLVVQGTHRALPKRHTSSEPGLPHSAPARSNRGCEGESDAIPGLQRDIFAPPLTQSFY